MARMSKTQAKRKKLRDFFNRRVPLYQKDPVLYAREVLLFEPDEWQESVLRDLAESPWVTVRSGQGVGKTGVEAVALLWFLTCFRFPRVVATAPTRQQLHDVLWSEVEKWRSNSPLLRELLKWTKTYVYMKGYEKRWFAVARTASKPENMQGFHEDNMLFIVDEASGVEDEIMEAILGTLSGANNKLLMCGNPTRTSGTFYDSHTANRGLYKCHKVSSLDSARTNKKTIHALIRKYGEHSNVVQVRVFGNFPSQEDDVFIPLTLVEKSIALDLEPPATRISLGVDVARYGDDETVIAQNVGGKVSIPIIRRGQNLMRTVGDIVLQYRKLLSDYPKYRGRVYVNIDDTGLGGGVTDRLAEVKREQHLSRLEIIPVNFGAKVPDQDASVYFADITSYMWSIIRDAMEAGTLRLPNDTELVAQLSVRKYTVTSGGKIQLESKKEMKKRSIDSPDRADAVALTCFVKKIFNAASLTS